jgi:hypothetical protein
MDHLLLVMISTENGAGLMEEKDPVLSFQAKSMGNWRILNHFAI